MFNLFTGIVSGVVSGLGIGGGTILILVLTAFQGVEQHIAQATNLIFYIPTSIVAIIVNIRNKLIDKSLVITISVVGIIGAILGAIIANKTDVTILRKFFGFFLAIIAIYEIYSYFKVYIKGNKRDNI